MTAASTVPVVSMTVADGHGAKSAASAAAMVGSASACCYRPGRDAVQLDQIGLGRSRQLDRGVAQSRVGPGCVEHDGAPTLQHGPSVVQQRPVGGLGDFRLVQAGPVRRRARLVQTAAHSGLAHAGQAADQHEANLRGTQVMQRDPDAGAGLQLRCRIALSGPQARHLGPHEGAVRDVVMFQGGHSRRAGELHVPVQERPPQRRRAEPLEVHGEERGVVEAVHVAQPVVELEAVECSRPVRQQEHVVGEQVAMAVADQASGRASEEQRLPRSEIAQRKALDLRGLRLVQDAPAERPGLLEARLPALPHRVPRALGRRLLIVPGGGMEGRQLLGECT